MTKVKLNKFFKFEKLIIKNKFLFLKKNKRNKSESKFTVI